MNSISLDLTRILIIVLLTATLQLRAATQEKVRTIPHQHVPIESLLRSDDQIVEMDYWADLHYVTYGNESREETVHRMTRETDIIATVRITQVEPFLVEDGSWVRTRVAGTADNVLKGPDDKKFEAQFDGGEMVIKGVRVKAGSYPVLRPGSRYLIFLHTVDGVPWILHVFSLEKQNAVNRPEWARAKGLPENPFAGRSVQQTISEVKKALGRR